MIKKVFIKEEVTTEILHITSNNLKHNTDYSFIIYQKQWKIALYYKSIK